MLARADGTIVAGGVAVQADRDVLALVRYTARGELDPTFGTGGVVLQPVGDGFSALTALAEGPGGSVLATGQAGLRLLVARFTAAGALDAGFGVGGLVYLILGYRGVRKQSDEQDVLLKAEGLL